MEQAFLVCTLLKYDIAIWLPDPMAMNQKSGYHHSQNRRFFVVKPHTMPESINSKVDQSPLSLFDTMSHNWLYITLILTKICQRDESKETSFDMK